ncbi:hypothetical protein D3C85_1615630 [compost metagenome]
MVVESADIPSVQPAPPPQFCGSLWIVVISGSQVRSAHHNFADGDPISGHCIHILIDNTNLRHKYRHTLGQTEVEFLLLRIFRLG